MPVSGVSYLRSNNRSIIPRRSSSHSPITSAYRTLDFTASQIVKNSLSSPEASYLFALPGLTIAIGASLALGVRAGIKRLFRRDRGRRKAATKMEDGSIARFSVATFNIRGVMDRWAERKPVLQQCIKDIDADVLCFQECLTGEYGQDKSILNSTYHVFPCKAALFNLLASPIFAFRLYAKSVEAMLSLFPFQRCMVHMPASIEAFREKYNLEGSFFRSLRDFAIAPFFGNSVACRLADAHEINHSTLVLGDWRAAQRIEFELGDGDGISQDAFVDGVKTSTQPSTTSTSNATSTHIAIENISLPHAVRPSRTPHSSISSRRGRKKNTSATNTNTNNSENNNSENESEKFKVWVVNMHLDHQHQDIRQSQALHVAQWMENDRRDAAAVVLCGDFNGPPQEPFHQALKDLGYSSGYQLRHGKEPEGTWPTGIQAPLMDHGTFECLDYIYVWAAEGYEVRVLDAGIFGNSPTEKDNTLYPSDHAAVKVMLELEKVSPIVKKQE